MLSGGCDCGAVRFEITQARPTVTVCHCSQCRRTSGHLWASTRVPRDKLCIVREDGLTWYRSSDFAQRGFCNRCGSSLFYQIDGKDATGVAAGALDGPTGLTTGKHIFVQDKGDYYEIADSAPQIERY